MKEHPIRFALRNLRHLYEQMLAGHIGSQRSAAEGLLSPAIKTIERECEILMTEWEDSSK